MYTRPRSLHRFDLVSTQMGANMAAIADRGDPRYRDLVWDVRQTLEPRRNAERLAEWEAKRT